MSEQERVSDVGEERMPALDRRRFLQGTSAALMTAALSGGAEGQSVESAGQARKDASVTDPGPENELLKQANPFTFVPPATDHGEVRTFWSSFSTAHRPDTGGRLVAAGYGR